MPHADAAARKDYQASYNQREDVRARRRRAFKAWRDANKARLRAKEANRRLNQRASCLVATVRTRARKRGLEFDLDEHVPALQARIDAGICELTGELFDLSPGRKFNSPSIDRIDSARGYTIDNVRVILNLANAALGDWGEEVLLGVMSRWLLRLPAMPSSRKSLRSSSPRISTAAENGSSHDS